MTRTIHVRLGLVAVGALLTMLVTIQPGHSQPYPPGPPGGGIRGGPPPGPVGPAGSPRRNSRRVCLVGRPASRGSGRPRPPAIPRPPEMPRPPDIPGPGGGFGRRPGIGVSQAASPSMTGVVLHVVGTWELAPRRRPLASVRVAGRGLKAPRSWTARPATWHRRTANASAAGHTAGRPAGGIRQPAPRCRSAG